MLEDDARACALTELTRHMDRATRIVAVVGFIVAISVGLAAMSTLETSDLRWGPMPRSYGLGRLGQYGGKAESVYLGCAVATLVPLYVVHRFVRAIVVRSFLAEAHVRWGLSDEAAREVAALVS